MLKVFINDIDRTDYLEQTSVQINDQIQNKANTLRFVLIPGLGTSPEENQEVFLYDTVKLVSASGSTIVIEDKTASGFSVLSKEVLTSGDPFFGNGRGKFRTGEAFWLGVGISTLEKVTIASIARHTTPGQVVITSTANILNAHSSNEDCGKRVFGGVISSISKENPRLLSDVNFVIDCYDFTKIFDKKNINDSWEDVDARYVVNDFMNTTVNYNKVVDAMDYDNQTALRAEWIESGDGNNPNLETASIIQGTSAAEFPWTNSGGTALFSATPTSSDYSPFTGASSGAPTKGNATFWYKIASGATSVGLRLGSDASNYVTVSFVPIMDGEWHFISLSLKLGSLTGTPVWTALDYAAIAITETASGSIFIDDIRVTADKSFTMYGLEATPLFDDIRASFKKPTVFMERIAKTLSYYWYVDYERDVALFDKETRPAPFSVTTTSDNFDELTVDIDASQIKNRQAVVGGTKPSDSLYSQVFEGNNATREWVLKAKFENLSIKLDDGSDTDTTEAGTNTTTVNATGHGLVTGDYITNRTRANAVRRITRITNDQFTVEAVPSQTNGDSFTKFTVAKTVGVENLVDETTVDYVSNYQEKSIRATESEATLESGEFILLTYNEIVAIRTQVSNPASIAALKLILGGDGIFDGAVIVDSSLDSAQAARDRAQAEINAYSNPIVSIKFKTDHEGLESGQSVRVTDPAKGIDGDFVIQKVRADYRTNDYPRFDVTAASTLFGIIEYFQKLSAAFNDRDIDPDAIIDQIISEVETINLTESNTIGASEQVTESPTITITPSETATDRNMTTDPYLWQPDASDARYNLAQWG